MAIPDKSGDYVRTSDVECNGAIKAEFINGDSEDFQRERLIRWPSSNETPFDAHRNAAMALVGPGWTVECSEAPKMGVLVWPVYAARDDQDVADADNIPPNQQPVE